VAKVKRQSLDDSPPIDKRVLRSKEAVLAATSQLLTEFGLGGVSVDAVAERSGVAKTTIYRHWPSRAALLVDACSKMGSKLDVPETGSVRGDLMQLATTVATRLSSARFATVLPSIIDAAERDPELAALHARLHAGIISAIRTVVERGQKSGDLPRTRAPSELVAAIMGPLFYRRWFSREPLDEGFVRGVVENITGDASRKR
jgi:AcrR family transcriptional regulator